jgi:hypothetical protein
LRNIDVVGDEDFDEFEVGNPNSASEWGTFGPYQLVGHGHKTNDNCGRFSSHWGCVRVELHGHGDGQRDLNGNDFSGQVYHRLVFYSCDKPSCSVCYEYGWASREAHKIEVRVVELESQKRFGKAEHFVATVPPHFYGLSDEALRAKIIEVLRACGVVGGCLIFHGFRWDEVHRVWYWSPHFHVLGFILGGYKCRGCKKECVKGCGCGFNDLQYRAFEKFGCIVKVAEDKYGRKDARKTIGGTAWYQLNHATIRTDVKRPHAVTWFGVASYRALKVKVEKRKVLCPLCRHECVKLLYFGSKNFVLDRDSPYFVRDGFDDLVEDGRVVWVEDTRPSYRGSGSYEA